MNALRRSSAPLNDANMCAGRVYGQALNQGDAMTYHVFTRAQLYDLVWAEPMRTVAKRHGVSDVGLAKACRRADIPVPERGYWAKLQHGKAVSQPPLPRRPDLPDQVVLAPPMPRPPPSPAAQAVLETAEPPKVDMPSEGARAHWLVRQWDEAEKARRRELKALSGAWYKPPPAQAPSDLDLRIRRLYSALLRALEVAGFTVGDGERGGEVKAAKDGEAIAFRIYERQRKARRPLTDDEKSYSWNKGKTDKPDLVSTGDLVLKIRTYTRGAMAEDYRDQKAPLETQLGQGIVAFGPASRSWACGDKNRRRRKSAIDRISARASAEPSGGLLKRRSAIDCSRPPPAPARRRIYGPILRR